MTYTEYDGGIEIKTKKNKNFLKNTVKVLHEGSCKTLQKTNTAIVKKIIKS